MKKINKCIISFFVFTFVLLFIPLYNIHAATIGFSPTSESYKVGDTINIKVYVSTASTSINAISATIKFPTDILSLSSISKTGSIINLWAQEPSFSNVDGTASFEGVVLNGYNGNAGNAITLVFRAKIAGIANLKFNTASVLANDGNGTEVLTSKGTSNLSILKIENPLPSVVTPKKEELLIKPSIKDTSILISEIKNNTSKYSPNKFLITSTANVADKTYNIQIDSNPPIIWTDDGTHVFQAPELSNGLHSIKIMAVDTNSNTLSGFLNFSTTVLKVPSITYFPDDLFVDEFLVLKGNADPSLEVELVISNVDSGAMTIDHVNTNSDGEFTYVSDDKIPAGNYSVIARSMAVNGINSEYMNPIQIVSKEHKLNFFVSKFSGYITLLIPFIALLSFIIIIVIYAHYRIKKFRILLNKKLMNTENIISKSFDLLDEDIEEELAVFKKIRGNKLLNSDEQIFLDKFKKDIKEAEKIIQKELKEISKDK